MEIFVAGCSLSWTDRFNSCYLIDKHILFDCGEGTTKSLVREHGANILREIDWIFISHFHVDHLFAINNFLTQNILYKKGLKHKLTIVGLKGLNKVLQDLLIFTTAKDYKIEDFINVIEVDECSKPIKVDGYEVSFCNLNHGDYDDLGFVIRDGKFALGYTGDTEYDKNLVAMAEKCDTLICDVSGEMNTKNHMGVEGYSLLKTQFPTKKFYAVHCNEDVYNNAKKHKLTLLHESRIYNFEKGKLALKR